MYFSLGLGIPAIVLAVLLLLFLNKFGSTTSSGTTAPGQSKLKISYSNNKHEAQINEDIHSFANPNVE